MARLYGWAPLGKRCRDSTPFGHRKTLTFIAGQRLSGLTASWPLDGPMDGNAFLVCVRDIPVPTLKPDDVVVLDNLPSHKVAGVQKSIAARQAQIFYLPPYSPELNRIEMAFYMLCGDTNLQEPSTRLSPASDPTGSTPTRRMRQLLQRCRVSTLNMKCSSHCF